MGGVGFVVVGFRNLGAPRFSQRSQDLTVHVYAVFSFKSGVWGEGGLRGPAAILFISRDSCSDSIAKLFRACFFWGIAQL